MPKKPHPKDAVAKPQIQETEIHVAHNSQVDTRQANQTFELTAASGCALGIGGETRGYGKPLVSEMARELSETTAILFERYDNKKDENGVVIKGMLRDRRVGGDRGMLTRQVATYQADKFLKLDTVSEEKYGVNRDGGVFGVSIQADGAGVTSKKGLLDVDLSRPEIQRGLSDLEVSDFITGQVDRHAGNIFIDPVTGKVTGIDNDMGLPEVSREEILRRDKALNAKMVTGMPSRMHQETADKILQADPEALRAVLSTPPPPGGPQPLSPAAIDGAVNRLKQLQAELRKPDSSIEVVAKFDDHTYQAALNEQVQSFNNDPLNAKYGVTLDTLDPMDVGPLDTCQKSSYIGAIDMMKRKDALAPKEQQMAVNKVAPPAERVPGYDHEFLSKIAEAYPKMTAGQQKTLDQDLKTLAKLESKLGEKVDHRSRIEHPGVLDRLAALRKGGVAAARQSDDAKINALNQDIARLKSSISQQSQAVIGPSVAPPRPTTQAPERPATKMGQEPTVAESQGEKPQVRKVREMMGGAKPKGPSDLFQRLGEMQDQSLGPVDAMQPRPPGGGRSIREDHPELVHNEGQKQEGHQQHRGVK